MPKRALWICNHTTLMETECKILSELGFEVFVPKNISDLNLVSKTANIDYVWDKTLTLPKDVLLKLNSFDFYGGILTPEIENILNKYFDVCISIPLFPFVSNLAYTFKKTFILRVFGREEERIYEDSNLDQMEIDKFNLKDRILYKLMEKYEFLRPKEILKFCPNIFALWAKRKRFLFGASYREIIEYESFFKKYSAHLPLAVPDSIFKNENTWLGSENRIMFVCPSIDNIYYGGIYNEFKENFGEFPHTIFGRQNKEFDDKNIRGFVPREEFDCALKNYKCMFYHSREKKHLHYHPLEAIVFGMPLIYMSGGLLEKFGGSEQPGMARTLDEAKEKIKRILDGDSSFIDEIKSRQVKILDEFREDYVKGVWEEKFLPFVLKGVRK